MLGGASKTFVRNCVSGSDLIRFDEPRTGLQRLFNASVTEKVVRGSSRPVLVLPARTPAPA